MNRFTTRLAATAATVMITAGLFATEEGTRLFGHDNIIDAFFGQNFCLGESLDISAGAGTTGFGIDLTTPITHTVRLRTGFTWVPRIEPTMTFGIESGRINESGEWVNTNFASMSDKMRELTGFSVEPDVDMQGVPSFWNFKLLADIYPLKENRNWRVTAGFYAGPKRVARAFNSTEDMPSLMGVCIYNNIYDKVAMEEPIFGEDIYFPPEIDEKIMNIGLMGIHVGDFTESGEPYRMQPDGNAMVKARIFVNSFRPYLGIGYDTDKFIHAERLSLSFDGGIMFWGGTPRIETHDGTNLARDVKDISGKVGRYVRYISGFKAYPVLEVRVSYTLF